jgi:hypothetical protein
MRFNVDVNASFLDFDGRSSLHAVKARGTNLRGYLDAEWSDGHIALDPAPRMHLEIPVDGINSGNALEDRQMRQLIGSRSFPNIVADLTQLRALDAEDTYAVTGSISLRGSTKTTDGVIVLRKNGERLVVDGEKSVDMRDFDIRPPRMLMLQVYPDLRIRMHVEGVA